MKRKRIALIGYGYWGPNLIRNLFDNLNCEVAYCCDKSVERLNLVKKRYPGLHTTDKFAKVLADQTVDGIVLTTPTSTHFPLAEAAIKAGKDVLIEKPMVANFEEATALQKLAKDYQRIVMVDHTFLFNDAVRKIKSLIDSGKLGRILYIDSVRANLGLIQNDINVIYDLASHDFSIIEYLTGQKPRAVKSHGSAHFNKQEDVAYIIAEYPRKLFAHVHVSWLSPLKVRQMLVIGTKKMVVYDDLEPNEKIRVYDKGVFFTKRENQIDEQIKIGYRSGDVWLPKVDVSEPLANLVDTFIKSMTTREYTFSGVNFGADVVEVLDRATKSLRTGRRVLV